MPRGRKAEKRIYVIVPETVQSQRSVGGHLFGVTRRMETGRLMAQAAHVVSRMRLDPDVQARYGDKPITTIVLSVRNSRELMKVFGELLACTFVCDFEDHNPEFYGTKCKVLTALCTFPVLKEAVDDAIGHLELYGA